MCTVLIALALLTQESPAIAPSDAFQVFDRISQAANASKERHLLQSAQSSESKLKEHEFVERFNALVKALSEVSQTYRAKHAIDVRSVQSVKKAYRDLERADPWFKIDQ